MTTTKARAYKLDVRLHRHGATSSEVLRPVEFQAQKTLSSVSGGWALQLGPSRLPVPWQEIADDDWVSIVLEDHAARTRDLISWGPVDSVREASTTGENHLTVRNITITGRDFAKALEVGELFFDTYLQNAAVDIPGNIDTREYGALADLTATNPLVTPAKAIARLLAIITPGIMRLPPSLGSKPLGDILHYASDVELGQLLNLAGYAPTGNARLDGYLRGLLLTPFHDFFYDMRPATGSALVAAAAKDTAVRATTAPLTFLQEFGLAPTIVYRNTPSPFGDSAGAHEIRLSEELSADLGRGGSERFTMLTTTGPAWAAHMASGTYGGSGGRLPVFDNDGKTATEIAKHGIRYLSLPDATAPTSAYGSERKVPIEWLVDRVRQAYELYTVLPEALSGTSRLAHVRAEVRIGDTAVRDGYRYRVEQVAHSGRVLDSGLTQAQTTLALSRGVKVGRKPPAIPPGWLR